MEMSRHPASGFTEQIPTTDVPGFRDNGFGEEDGKSFLEKF